MTKPKPPYGPSDPLLERLNSLTPYHYQYGTWLDEVVSDFPIDSEATRLADPDGTNRIIVLDDGTTYFYSDGIDQWFMIAIE